MIISKTTDMNYDHNKFIDAFNGVITADASSARYAERNSENENEYVAMYVTNLWTTELSVEDKAMVSDPFEEMIMTGLIKDGGEFLKERLISFLVTEKNPIHYWMNQWTYNNTCEDLRKICIRATKNLESNNVNIVFEEDDFYPTDWKLQSEFVEKFFSTFSRIATL